MTKTIDDGRALLARAGIQPRGLSLAEAAAYVGLSPNGFLRQVAAGTYPPPKAQSGARNVWDRLALDAAFDGGHKQKRANDVDEAIDAAGPEIRSRVPGSGQGLSVLQARKRQKKIARSSVAGILD